LMTGARAPRACLLAVSDSKVVQAVGFSGAAVQLPEDGETLLVASERLRILPKAFIDEPEAIQAVGLTAAVPQFPAKGEAVLVARYRLRKAPLLPVDDAKVDLAGILDISTI